MDWRNVLYRWQSYSEILYPLRDEVSDIFKTKYVWDNYWNCEERNYEADEDTVFLLKLSEMLNDICDFVKSHIGVLEHRVSIEEEKRANQEQAFEAWKRGLCPVAMKSVPRYVRLDSFDYWETYDEVAQFLADKRMSYAATKRAIEVWLLSHEKLKISA
ncbi:MAG: hypothetical protein IJQ08_05645 [Synergistaceae bacterium]|nr:hypothetical protein [Synergistaceae bacterium]